VVPLNDVKSAFPPLHLFYHTSAGNTRKTVPFLDVFYGILHLFLGHFFKQETFAGGEKAVINAGAKRRLAVSTQLYYNYVTGNVENLDFRIRNVDSGCGS